MLDLDADSVLIHINRVPALRRLRAAALPYAVVACAGGTLERERSGVMVWIKGLWVALVAAAVVWLALAAWGASRWRAQTRALEARLEAARLPPSPTHYDALRELAGLPAPVQRYFRAALKDGQPIVAAATVTHSGSFNQSATGEQWRPFTSSQRVVTRRPGFVWDGRIAALPGLAVHVHDAYIAGEGLLHPAVLGLVSLMMLRGGGEIAHGQLMRYLAEAACYPTALLPSQGVRWSPGPDEPSAQATLSDGPTSVTLLFRFDAKQGLIESVRADARGRSVGKTIVMTPWEGRWAGHDERDGMQVPLTGEVAWITPQGRRAYWRGTVTGVQYESATIAPVRDPSRQNP